MIASGISSLRSSGEAQGGSDRRFILLRPRENVREYGTGIPTRPPVSVAEQPAAIGDVNRHITGTLGGGSAHIHLLAGERSAELGRFVQREAARSPAADVRSDSTPVIGARKLVVE